MRCTFHLFSNSGMDIILLCFRRDTKFLLTVASARWLRLSFSILSLDFSRDFNSSTNNTREFTSTASKKQKTQWIFMNTQNSKLCYILTAIHNLPHLFQQFSQSANIPRECSEFCFTVAAGSLWEHSELTPWTYQLWKQVSPTDWVRGRSCVFFYNFLLQPQHSK